MGVGLRALTSSKARVKSSGQPASQTAERSWVELSSRRCRPAGTLTSCRRSSTIGMTSRRSASARHAADPWARAQSLLLVEQVVPTGNEYHSSKFDDLNMLVLFRGRERTAEELLPRRLALPGQLASRLQSVALKHR